MTTQLTDRGTTAHGENDGPTTDGTRGTTPSTAATTPPRPRTDVAPSTR